MLYMFGGDIFHVLIHQIPLSKLMMQKGTNIILTRVC